MRVPLEVEKQIEREKIAAYVVGHLPIVNGIFLKRPDRIEVLGLVLLLSLLIWRLIEREMRQYVIREKRGGKKGQPPGRQPLCS